MKVTSYKNTRYVFLKEFTIAESNNYIVKAFDLEEKVFKTLVIPKENFEKIVRLDK